MSYGGSPRDFQHQSPQSSRFCTVFRTNIGSGNAHRGTSLPHQQQQQQTTAAPLVDFEYGGGGTGHSSAYTHRATTTAATTSGIGGSGRGYPGYSRPKQDIDSLLDELLGIGSGGGGSGGGGGTNRPTERYRHRSTEPMETLRSGFSYQHQQQQHQQLRQPHQQPHHHHQQQQQHFSSSSSTTGGGIRYHHSGGGGGGGGSGVDGFQTERERQLALELRRTQKKLRKLRKAASDCGYDLEEERRFDFSERQQQQHQQHQQHQHQQHQQHQHQQNYFPKSHGVAAPFEDAFQSLGGRFRHQSESRETGGPKFSQPHHHQQPVWEKQYHTFSRQSSEHNKDAGGFLGGRSHVASSTLPLGGGQPQYSRQQQHWESRRHVESSGGGQGDDSFDSKLQELERSLDRVRQKIKVTGSSHRASSVSHFRTTEAPLMQHHQHHGAAADSGHMTHSRHQERRTMQQRSVTQTPGEVYQEVETITLQPIGKGIHDLEAPKEAGEVAGRSGGRQMAQSTPHLPTAAAAAAASGGGGIFQAKQSINISQRRMATLRSSTPQPQSGATVTTAAHVHQQGFAGQPQARGPAPVQLIGHQELQQQQQQESGGGRLAHSSSVPPDFGEPVQSPMSLPLPSRGTGDQARRYETYSLMRQTEQHSSSGARQQPIAIELQQQQQPHTVEVVRAPLSVNSGVGRSYGQQQQQQHQPIVSRGIQEDNSSAGVGGNGFVGYSEQRRIVTEHQQRQQHQQRQHQQQQQQQHYQREIDPALLSPVSTVSSVVHQHSQQQQQHHQHQQQQLPAFPVAPLSPGETSSNFSHPSSLNGSVDALNSPGGGPAGSGSQAAVKDSMKLWYRPRISRDEAINLLRNAQSGTFVVRDSNSFPGAFGLAVRVAQIPKGIQPKSSDIGAELVRHFLIEPTSGGVRLKGCANEPIFPTLAALVHQHSLTQLALPCRLLVPRLEASMYDQPDRVTAQLASAGGDSVESHRTAACNILYIGSVDVESLAGSEAIARAVDVVLSSQNQLRTAECQLKVSPEGIMLTDNQRKLFFRRNYPTASILYCGLDNMDRRFNHPELTTRGLQSPRLFGFVARKGSHFGQSEGTCIVACELDAQQPAPAIVSFINKLLIQQKR